MSEGNLLSEEITQRLLHEIREGCYANCRKLPPELTLAKEMGVSRTLIRDCLFRFGKGRIYQSEAWRGNDCESAYSECNDKNGS